MNWLVVRLAVDMVGMGGLATYWAFGVHRRTRMHAEPAPAAGARKFAVWGPGIDCGIDAVDPEGHVVGMVLVPAPSLN
jgi:hypothetical protein